jgi:hypothetical protein
VTKAYAFIKKWRANRPRPMLVTLTPALTETLFTAKRACEASLPKELKGTTLEKKDVPQAKFLLEKQLAAKKWGAAWVDSPTAIRCPPEKSIWIGTIWLLEGKKFDEVCVAKVPNVGIEPGACVTTYEHRGGKTVAKGRNDWVWHDAFWGDELAIP